MNRKLLTSVIVAIVMFVTGCQDAPSGGNRDLVEWVHVSGTCAEDHVNVSDEYRGAVVHYRKPDDGSEMRYGSVHRVAELEQSVEETLARLENPGQYYPPFTIEFAEVPAEVFRLAEWDITGMSEHIPLGEAPDGGPRYRASCVLSAVERLDYMPSVGEQKAMGAM